MFILQSGHTHALRPEPCRPRRRRRAGSEWAPNEIFWIVKHGVKLSGMPAWGPLHSDEELWAITAFVKKLSGMSAESTRN